jgi:hypothetical protein
MEPLIHHSPTQPPSPPADQPSTGVHHLAPSSTFEALTKVQLAALERELTELKGRINSLLWAVISAAVIDVIKALF